MSFNAIKERTDNLYDRAWFSIRLLNKFSIPDILRTTAMDSMEIDIHLIKDFVHILHKHQFISINNGMYNNYFYNQYLLINDIGPTRPTVCDKCNSYLLLARLPISQQILLDAYWHNYHNCSSVYITSSSPIVTNGFTNGDYCIDIITKFIWQLDNIWVKTNIKIGDDPLKNAMDFYYSVNGDHLLDNRLIE